MDIRKKLTEKETPIMQMLWEHGPLFVRQMLEYYPEPKPHFNTVSTLVRILEDKGFVEHEVIGGSHRFYATAQPEDFARRSLGDVVRDYFDNSYKNVVSALVKDEKLTVDELREIIEIMEKSEPEQ